MILKNSSPVFHLPIKWNEKKKNKQIIHTIPFASCDRYFYEHCPFFSWIKTVRPRNQLKGVYENKGAIPTTVINKLKPGVLSKHNFRPKCSLIHVIKEDKGR